MTGVSAQAITWMPTARAFAQQLGELLAGAGRLVLVGALREAELVLLAAERAVALQAVDEHVDRGVGRRTGSPCWRRCSSSASSFMRLGHLAVLDHPRGVRQDGRDPLQVAGVRRVARPCRRG